MTGWRWQRRWRRRSTVVRCFYSGPPPAEPTPYPLYLWSAYRNSSKWLIARVGLFGGLNADNCRTFCLIPRLRTPDVGYTGYRVCRQPLADYNYRAVCPNSILGVCLCRSPQVIYTLYISACEMGAVGDLAPAGNIEITYGKPGKFTGSGIDYANCLSGFKGLFDEPYLLFLACFASIGGVLFGYVAHPYRLLRLTAASYDQGVISGVLVMNNFVRIKTVYLLPQSSD